MATLLGLLRTPFRILIPTIVFTMSTSLAVRTLLLPLLSSVCLRLLRLNATSSRTICVLHCIDLCHITDCTRISLQGDDGRILLNELIQLDIRLGVDHRQQIHTHILQFWNIQSCQERRNLPLIISHLLDATLLIHTIHFTSEPSDIHILCTHLQVQIP